MNKLSTRESSFITRFKKRYSLRLHMSLILLATVCAGLLATRAMLALHLKNLAVRYPLAVACAYLIFFVCVKLWLKFMVPAPAARGSSGNGLNIFGGSSSSGSSGGSGSPSFRGGGGEFGGAGATGSFGESAPSLTDSAPGVIAAGLDTGSGVAAAGGEAAGDAAGGVAGAVGDAASGVDDPKGCVVALVLLAVVAVICGAGVYLVFQAPLILSEAAFQAILAGGLVRGARRIEQGDWLGSVFKATWIPFILTLLLSFLAGFLMLHYFPGVTRISELFTNL